MNRHEFEKLFDAYLDGLLTGDRLRKMEELIRRHPELRARIESQERLDAMLRQRCAPSIGDTEVAAMLAEAQAKAGARPAFGGRRMLLAACVGVVLVGAAALVYLTRSPSATTPTGPTGGFTPRQFVYAEPGDVFREVEAKGFEPDWACADDVEFYAYTLNRFETPFLVRQPENVTLSGWTQSTVLSSYTGVLMGKVDGHDTVLLVDRLDDDRELAQPETQGLHLSRRVLGDLVFYEVSEDGAPGLLPLLYLPEDAPLGDEAPE